MRRTESMENGVCRMDNAVGDIEYGKCGKEDKK